MAEAGTHNTSRVRSNTKGNKELDGDEISFNSSFLEPKAVLHTLQTYNNGGFMTSLVTNITNKTFEIAQESLETNAISTEETIGWIAMTIGNGTTGNSSFIIGIGDNGEKNGVDDQEFTIDLSSAGFTVPGDVIVSAIVENGKNGAYARGSGTYSRTEQGVYAEEGEN